MKNKKKNGKLPKWAIFIIVGLSLLVYLPMILIIILTIYLTPTETSDLNTELIIKDTVQGYYNEKTNTYSITGYAQNTSNEDIDDIEIEYNLYDKNNNVIGTATAYLNELDENKTWHFTAEYTGINANNITHFEESLIDYNDSWD